MATKRGGRVNYYHVIGIMPYCNSLVGVIGKGSSVYRSHQQFNKSHFKDTKSFTPFAKSALESS